MRILIVHNQKSGFGSDAIYEFERSIVRPGDECVLRTLYDREHDQLAFADAERFDVVVVSGGDGTVSSALGTLAYRDVPTCVFPSGTANLFAANVGNASEPAALAMACRYRRTARLDLGEIRCELVDGSAVRRTFGLMAGSGFDAKLMSAAVPNKRTLGEAAYFAAALTNRRPEVVHFTIEVDGERIERNGIACIVANNAMLQGGLQLVPGCAMDDGMLDVVILQVDFTAQLIRPVVVGFMDREGTRKGRPYLESFRGSSVSVRSSHPLQMEVDGDVVGGEVLTWEARALKGAARLVVDDYSRYAGEGVL